MKYTKFTFFRPAFKFLSRLRFSAIKYGLLLFMAITLFLPVMMHPLMSASYSVAQSETQSNSQESQKNEPNTGTSSASSPNSNSQGSGRNQPRATSNGPVKQGDPSTSPPSGTTNKQNSLFELFVKRCRELLPIFLAIAASYYFFNCLKKQEQAVCNLRSELKKEIERTKEDVNSRVTLSTESIATKMTTKSETALIRNRINERLERLEQKILSIEDLMRENNRKIEREPISSVNAPESVYNWNLMPDQVKEIQTVQNSSPLAPYPAHSVSPIPGPIDIASTVTSDYQSALARNDRSALRSLTLGEMNITYDSEDALVRGTTMATQLEIVKGGGSYLLIERNNQHWLVPTFQTLSLLVETRQPPAKGLFTYEWQPIPGPQLSKPAEIRDIGNDRWEVVGMGLIILPA